MTRSEWASWFQAVASVVAILIAIAIPAIQHRRDTQLRIDDGHDRIAYALRLSYLLAEDLQRWLIIFNVNEDRLFDSVGMQDLRQRLARIDLQSLPPTLAERVSYVWFSLVQITATFQRPDGTSSFMRGNEDHERQVASWKSGAGQLSNAAAQAIGDHSRVTAAWPSMSPRELLDWLQEPDRSQRPPLSKSRIERYLRDRRIARQNQQ